ncbi:MAG TPA: CHAT domain-containing tetratricopeptide repeat protein [Blastocatellia bacterium]|nr:CHAT domain-containing tetratricopeptide repeat protein [Blastocatellia bacterium]
MVRPFQSFTRTIRLCSILLIATLALSQWRSSAKSHAQEINQPPTLTLGAPVESEITSEQPLTWLISVSAGDYLRLLVDANRDDVAAELFAPGQSGRFGDKPLFSAAGNVLNYHQTNIFSFIAEASGNYRLEVFVSDKDAISKRYEIKAQIKEQRPATSRDRTRIEAERAELEARRTSESATLKQRRQAIANYERALALWRELGEGQEELGMLQALGNQYSQLGELQTALNYNNQAIQIAQSLGDRYQEANLLVGLGGLYKDSGNYQKALDKYSQAKQIFASSSSGFGEALAIEAIGAIYLLLGDPQRAIDNFTLALPTFSSIGVKSRECNALNNLGAAHRKLGELIKALEYHNRALAIAREAGDAMSEARTIGYKGDVYYAMGQMRRAFDCYDSELKACKVMGAATCVAETLRSIGVVALSMGDRKNGLNLLNQALNQSRLNGQRQLEAVTLLQLARANYNSGDLFEALRQVEQSLEIAESMRADLVARDFRESFFNPVLRIISLQINILMALHEREPAAGYDALALQASERARARSLLEHLVESNAEIRQGVDPKLLERERALQRQLNAKAAARANASKNKGVEELAAALDKEIAELTAQYREVETQIRVSSPRYAALTQPEPVTVAEIQRDLLDQDTVLLEFSLTGRQGWLWAVTRDTLISYNLPNPTRIDAASRRIHELLTARQPKKGLTASQRETLIAEADVEFRSVAARMSRNLLLPIASKLRQEWKGKRLAIVASGALEYVPFAALPNPSASNYQPFIADHEVVNLPSASALALIRRQTSSRGAEMKTLAMLADPVFDAKDPRLVMLRKQKPGASGAGGRVRSADASSYSSAIGPKQRRSAPNFGASALRDGFSRLPFSREEADTIAKFVPKNSLLKATDFQANRATAVGAELSHYRIIHFATHGLLNSESPLLSGLVLSLVDKNGKPQDGFLRMHEIYNLQIPADLVVLSACQTALGKEIKGEGLVGLTRGFMHAGADRVVASLWQVDDRATAELMKRFYSGMLLEGMRPAAALRAAQIEIMKQKRWASPFFWAAFTLQGEWR